MPLVDRLGRRRRPAQNRGLRPLFPTLPDACQSRLLRVAMSASAWARLETLIAASAAPTPPRAIGEFMEGWLSPAAAQPAASRAAVAQPAWEAATDWQAWQVQKELGILASIKRRD